MKEGVHLFYYARYVDDTAFGVPVGKDTSGTINRILNNIKQLLKIDFTFKEFFREQRGDIGKLRVLGLMVALRDTGLMHVYIPHERWLRKMNIYIVEDCLRNAGLRIN